MYFVQRLQNLLIINVLGRGRVKSFIIYVANKICNLIEKMLKLETIDGTQNFWIWCCSAYSNINLVA